MNKIRSVFAVVTLLLLSACAPLFVSKTHVIEVADAQTGPVIAALENFRKRTGTYPASLDELAQSSDGAGVYIPHGARPSDKGWMDYWTTSQTSYVLVFSTTSSQVGYTNGKREDVYINPYR